MDEWQEGSLDVLPKLSADIGRQVQKRASWPRWVGFGGFVSAGMVLALGPSWSFLRHVPELLETVGRDPKEPD